MLQSENDNLNFKVDKNTNSVDLSIKSSGSSIVNIDTEGTEKKEISIKSNSEVYGPLTINVGDKITAITMDSVNLHDKGSVSSNVPITVSNLAAQPNTVSKLNGVTVSKELSISKSAALELAECNLKSANINLDLRTYTSSNYKQPILTGTLGEAPNSITLVKPKFLIFKGKFTDSCNSWKNKIDFSQTLFNDGSCDDIAALKVLEESKSLSILYNPDKAKGNNKGNKLSGGQIAGIVIGVVLAVGIIIGVVVFFVLKKKKGEASSDEN